MEWQLQAMETAAHTFEFIILAVALGVVGNTARYDLTWVMAGKKICIIKNSMKISIA